jgi:hypothetical protein
MDTVCRLVLTRTTGHSNIPVHLPNEGQTVTEQHPYPYQTQLAPAPPVPRNGLGTAGFVVGLIGLVFSPIPIIGVVAWPLVILGLIFSLVGFSRARKGQATNKGLAVAGIVLSAIGLVICILWVAVFTKAATDINNEANQVATVHYEVTGDAKNVTISYATYGDSISSSQESAATLPWTKDIQEKGLAKGGSLTVIAGADGGTVACKVVVDGKPVKTGSASGPFATASCSGF